MCVRVLHRLSLIEDNISERDEDEDEDEIEEYQSDSDAPYTLVRKEKDTMCTVLSLMTVISLNSTWPRYTVVVLML